MPVNGTWAGKDRSLKITVLISISGVIIGEGLREVIFPPYRNPKMKDGPKGELLPIRLAKETADFIEANKEQKFFAYLSFYSVHGPIQTAQPLWQKYQKKAAALGLAEARFKFDRTKGVRQVQDNPIYAGMMEITRQCCGHRPEKTA